VWTRRDKGLPPPKIKKPWSEIKPNEGHNVIVHFQKWGLLKFLISQNVDNLHLASGIASAKISELHGNSKLMRCLKCNQQFPKKEIWDEQKWGKGYRTQRVQKGQPNCPDCGGRIISSIVNFGDPLPREDLENAIEHSQKADVFLVVGSSLQVSPASHMPIYAKNNGAKIIIVNKQKTGLDDLADLRFYEDASRVLREIKEKIKVELK
jgi:NAD-dependent SIR2 family protein deacetylase